MRGKLPVDLNEIAQKRITPADAGKTLRHLIKVNWRKDHPRGCGENKYIVIVTYNYSGSPPRMRGKPKRLMVDSFGDRITPADAGKTVSHMWTFAER